MTTDRWLVLEGDWGGQIYLTVPARLVGDDADIYALLSKLDSYAWECNERDGADAYFYCPSEEGYDEEEGVAGGMGGGALEIGLWLHEEFCDDPRWRALVIELLGLPENV